MAAASATEELEALEQSRSRLEAALHSDENWRALRQSGAHGGDVADSAARRARDTRLEMALAGNAIYQAWNHLNAAIDALRARSTAQSQAAEAIVLPAPPAKPTYGPAELPDDIAELLRSDMPEDAPHGMQRSSGAEPATAGDPSPSARAGLADRLDELDDASETEVTVVGRPGGEGGHRDKDQARPTERQPPPVSADPPEATVTFVVREARAPLLPSAELPPDLGTVRSSALFERLRNLNAPPQPANETYSPSDAAAAAEAEVTIVSVEELRRRRESDERAGVVRRFRKALSGD